jgi:hypothetical protein
MALAREDLHDKLSGTIIFSAKLELIEYLQLNKGYDLEHLIYVRTARAILLD